MENFRILEDKMYKNVVDETNVVKELRYYINNQKNIKQKLSLLNDKNDLINYIVVCQKNIIELIFISTSLIQEGNNSQIQNIIIYSIEQIYLFILYYLERCVF